MAQLTTGIRGILSNPRLYDLFQDIAGARKFREMYVAEYIRPVGFERVLDIGCGTGAILELLPDSIDYVGFDASAEYINAAQCRFGNRARFFCEYLNDIRLNELGEFDVVLANGVIHHLKDDEVTNLCRISAEALMPSGRMITHDPCYSPKQSRVAHYIVGLDRGQNVRNGEAYAALLHPFFRDVQLDIRDDMLNFPYTHAIMVGKK
jgi:SAM-dependent methyltransferase